MEQYEEFMKFLDAAIRATNQHAKSLIGLNEKQMYYQHAKNLENCRRTLRKEYFAYEDWLQSGLYEVPEIKFEVIETPIRTLKH